MMAGFCQFFKIFFMEFINIGPVYYIRGWVGGERGGCMGGGKSLSLNKEEIRHK